MAPLGIEVCGGTKESSATSFSLLGFGISTTEVPWLLLVEAVDRSIAIPAAKGVDPSGSWCDDPTQI